MKYEITKEQILSLYMGGGNEGKLKEWFPEAFETVLENNKWYKHKDHTEVLIYPTEEDNHGHLFGYGFDIYGKWVKINEKASVNCLCNSLAKKRLVEATESEVFEALKNEAVKRGFVLGAYTKGFEGSENYIVKEGFNIDNCHLKVYVSGSFYKQRNIFDLSTGEWANVTEIITKEEAEKLLNKKIV